MIYHTGQSTYSTEYPYRTQQNSNSREKEIAAAAAAVHQKIQILEGAVDVHILESVVQ